MYIIVHKFTSLAKFFVQYISIMKEHFKITTSSDFELGNIVRKGKKYKNWKEGKL